ncbi:protein kinase domain-containing protein [Sorangium sp. So ce1024]|uniref:serine/threonine-protein kinase n=1 Tax=unclassified Sorangium TaxID=2621164 RepID=UPI003F0B0FAA
MCLPAEPLLAANTMVGEYRIDRKLGAGTFGEVYAGEHPLIGKKVAIKVLNRRFAAQPEAVARFVAEARAVNRIRQRNIIDIFAFGVLPALQRHYFVMELLDGMTLGELCRRRRRLPFPTIVPIVRGIADALDAVHEAGITHRDLKPDNVFLAAERDGTWFPKLLDFGVAKLADGEGSEVTSTGAVLGTPQYMAPEQARGQRTGPPADIYALGVLIHRMLTGRPLFSGVSAVDLMCKHAADPPPRMSSVCADLPRELDLPVLAMLEKRPGDRPPSASKAVADLLEAARRIGLLAQAGAPEEAGPAPASGPSSSGKLTPATGGAGRVSATWTPGRGTLETGGGAPVSATLETGGGAPVSATWTPGATSEAGDGAPVSAAWAPGRAASETGDGAPVSAAWAPGRATSETGDEAPVSAAWGPGTASLVREDPSTLTMDSAVAAGPEAIDASWGPGGRSDEGAGLAPEPAGAPPSSAGASPSSTVPDTERAAGPPGSAGGASTAPWSGPPGSAGGARRGADADGRSSSVRALAAIEASGARAAATGRRKLLVAGAAGLLAAALIWATGRPSGLPLLDGASAVALASAPAAAPSPSREVTPAPVVSAPPPAASAGPPPAAQEDTVSVRLTTRPADASVWIGGRRVGSASEPIALPRGSAPIELVLRKPGFEEARVQLSPDRDRTLDVSLSALPAPRRRAGAAVGGPAGAAVGGPAGAAGGSPAGAAVGSPAGAAGGSPAGAAGGEAALSQSHVDRILDQRE